MSSARTTPSSSNDASRARRCKTPLHKGLNGLAVE